MQVYLVKQMMQQEGCDMMLDVHGDEELPYNFISGNEGIPSWTPRLSNLQVRICSPRSNNCLVVSQVPGTILLAATGRVSAAP